MKAARWAYKVHDGTWAENNPLSGSLPPPSFFLSMHACAIHPSSAPYSLTHLMLYRVAQLLADLDMLTSVPYHIEVILSGTDVNIT